MNPVILKNWNWKFSFWFLWNSFLGLMVSILISWSGRFSLLETILIPQIAAHTLTLLINPTVAFVARAILATGKPDPKVLLFRLLPAALVATVAGVGLAYLIYFVSLNQVTFHYLRSHMITFLVFALFITFAMTVGITYMRYFVGLANAAKSEGLTGLHALEFPEKIHITFKGQKHIVPLENIEYISSSGRKSVVHTSQGDFETNLFIGKLLEQLPGSRFIQIHRGFIVSLEQVATLERIAQRYVVRLRDSGDMLPVSRHRLTELRFRLKKATFHNRSSSIHDSDS